MKKIRINEVIIVEGKYDKIALESVVDGLILTTEGFGIFKNKEKQALFRRLANERGLLVLTDSDGAGLVIRGFINGCVDPSRVKHAYIPQLPGKEKRKSAPSKEGTLGVEGMTVQVLAEVLERAGVTVSEGASERPQITRIMLYEDGYIGGENSAEKRRLLLSALGLPLQLSTTALLKVINMVCDIDQYGSITRVISENTEEKFIAK